MLNDQKIELAVRLRHALELADQLKLWDVGASLDRALVMLTGRGVPFSQRPEGIA